MYAERDTILPWLSQLMWLIVEVDTSVVTSSSQAQVSRVHVFNDSTHREPFSLNAAETVTVLTSACLLNIQCNRERNPGSMVILACLLAAPSALKVLSNSLCY